MANDPVKPEWMIYADRAKAKQAGLSMEEHAKQVAAEVHGEVAPKGTLPPEQGWLAFAPMPSDMCRVSPFFPMAPKQLSDRQLIRGMVIAKSSWGEITYSGPKLSTFEEDILLAVLALLKSVEPVEEDGKPTWTYTGPLRPILTAIGYKTTGKRNYERVKTALELLQMGVVRLQTKRGLWERVNMVMRSGGNDKAATVSVSVNPYFAEMYAAGAVNMLDLAKRAQLSRPISKALHRFATSHRGPWRGHFSTLADAINLVDNPPYELRRQIKQAMADLRKIGVLSRKSRFDKDIVTLDLITTTPEAIRE